VERNFAEVLKNFAGHSENNFAGQNNYADRSFKQRCKKLEFLT